MSQRPKGRADKTKPYLEHVRVCVSVRAFPTNSWFPVSCREQPPSTSPFGTSALDLSIKIPPVFNNVGSTRSAAQPELSTILFGFLCPLTPPTCLFWFRLIFKTNTTSSVFSACGYLYLFAC